MAKSAVLNIENTWLSISLEERIELVQKAQASGFLACITAVMVIGAIAYGLDHITLLFFGSGLSLFFFPIFSKYTWRREKPALILAYLAVRSMARRFAYAYNIPDMDIVFIYKGQMQELYNNPEDAHKKQSKVDFSLDSYPVEVKDIWIVLMRGGLVLLSECSGGAKLEFLTHFTQESIARKPKETEDASRNSVVIEGVLGSKNRTIAITSRFQGAHYVFEKKITQLISAVPPKTPKTAIAHKTKALKG